MNKTKKLIVMALISGALLAVGDFCNGMVDNGQDDTGVASCSDSGCDSKHHNHNFCVSNTRKFKSKFKALCSSLSTQARCPQLQKGCLALCIQLENGAKRCCPATKRCGSKFLSALNPRNWRCARPTKQNSSYMLVSAIILAAIATGVQHVLPETWEDITAVAGELFKKLPVYGQVYVQNITSGQGDYDSSPNITAYVVTDQPSAQN